MSYLQYYMQIQIVLNICDSYSGAFSTVWFDVLSGLP